MDVFRNKLVATHIHDNHGRGDVGPVDPDEHLLPFEGNVDYARVMQKINEYSFEGALMLELNNRRYSEWSHEDFLAECYKRLKKISES